MTVEEKISHIREAAMEEARARGNEIIDQHQKALEGVFKTHKQEAVMQADTRIKTETASARQQLNTVTSKGQNYLYPILQKRRDSQMGIH